MKLLASIASLQPDGQQHQRSKAVLVRRGRGPPAQEAYGQIQDVDALLFFERARVDGQIQQALLQALRGHPRIELAVPLARAAARLVQLFVRLRDEFRIRRIVWS